MDQTPATIEALETTFDLQFQLGYEGYEPWHEKIATVTTSKGKKKSYGWRARIPQMREWIGPRTVHNVVLYFQEIVNRKFELTVGVDVEAIEDDIFDIYGADFMGMGEEVAYHPDALVFAQIAAGRTTPAFDGVPFFATNHPVAVKKRSLGTYPNLYTNKPLTPDNFRAVLADFKSRLAEDGRPLKLGRKLVLVVGPALEMTARALLQSSVLPSSLGTATAGTAIQENVLKGVAEVLVIPEFGTLGTGLDWMLVEAGKPIKPFVYQTRVAPVFAALVNPTDPNVWEQDQLQFGVRSRDAAGVSLPFLVSYCTPGA